MKHLPRLRWPFAGWGPRALPGTADTRRGLSPGPRGGPDTECSPALRSLFSPPPGLALTAPAVLKATEPHFAAADFCPEPRRCRLRAGSLTPRAGRQRATATAAFRWPRKPGRCRSGLGGLDLHLGCSGVNPQAASCGPLGARTRATEAEEGVGSEPGNQPVCTGGHGSGKPRLNLPLAGLLPSPLLAPFQALKISPLKSRGSVHHLKQGAWWGMKVRPWAQITRGWLRDLGWGGETRKVCPPGVQTTWGGGGGRVEG